MANPKKLLASAAVAAALVGGGVAGFVLGVPGVSGAQTTTVPNSPNATTPPNQGPSNQAPSNPDRHHDGNCPNMGGGGQRGGTPGQAPATGTGANLAFRHAGRGGVRA